MEALEMMKPSRLQRQKRRDKRLGEELMECSRYGSGHNLKNGYKFRVRRHNFEAARSHESIKFMHKGGDRCFTDNLEPLKRFLNRRVGKNWDKVYGQLCRQLDKRQVAGLHVFNHIHDYVVEHTLIGNGEVYYLFQGRYRTLVSTERNPRFYIDSKTGQLRKARLVGTQQSWRYYNERLPEEIWQGNGSVAPKK